MPGRALTSRSDLARTVQNQRAMVRRRVRCRRRRRPSRAAISTSAGWSRYILNGCLCQLNSFLRLLNGCLRLLNGSLRLLDGCLRLLDGCLRLLNGCLPRCFGGLEQEQQSNLESATSSRAAADNRAMETWSWSKTGAGVVAKSPPGVKQAEQDIGGSMWADANPELKAVLTAEEVRLRDAIGSPLAPPTSSDGSPTPRRKGPRPRPPGPRPA